MPAKLFVFSTGKSCSYDFSIFSPTLNVKMYWWKTKDERTAVRIYIYMFIRPKFYTEFCSESFFFRKLWWLIIVYKLDKIQSYNVIPFPSKTAAHSIRITTVYSHNLQIDINFIETFRYLLTNVRWTHFCQHSNQVFFLFSRKKSQSRYITKSRK